METTITNDAEGFPAAKQPEGKLANTLTWVLQGLVSLLFLFAGASKFFVPAEEMAKSSPLPISFIYFIGVCEVLGAFGLILPGALKIRRGLTPAAAIGLTIIMVGAVVVSFRMDPKMAILPLVSGVLTALIAYRRWPWFRG